MNRSATICYCIEFLDIAFGILPLCFKADRKGFVLPDSVFCDSVGKAFRIIPNYGYADKGQSIFHAELSDMPLRVNAFQKL